jgi:YHS domain-containing protein
MKALKIFFIALAAASAPMTAAFADEPRIFVASTSQYAVSSYDPVADFTVGAPTRGSDQWVATYQGARYRFASQANRDAFVASPARYAPQYGGSCALAVSQGYVARWRPENWRIVNGRLYLNLDDGVQRRWERDIPGNISRGDANWPTALGDFRGPRQ